MLFFIGVYFCIIFNEPRFQFFGDGSRVESLITYLQELDKNLGESNDIYQVRDEVRESCLTSNIALTHVKFTF